MSDWRRTTWEGFCRQLEVVEQIGQDVRKLRQFLEMVFGAGATAVGARAPIEAVVSIGASAPIEAGLAGVEAPGLEMLGQQPQLKEGHRGVGECVPTPNGGAGEGNSVAGELSRRQKRRAGEGKRKLLKKGKAAELEGLEVTGKLHRLLYYYNI
jgi:hypothetical protein